MRGELVERHRGEKWNVVNGERQTSMAFECLKCSNVKCQESYDEVILSWLSVSIDFHFILESRGIHGR